MYEGMSILVGGASVPGAWHTVALNSHAAAAAPTGGGRSRRTRLAQGARSALTGASVLLAAQSAPSRTAQASALPRTLQASLLVGVEVVVVVVAVMAVMAAGTHGPTLAGGSPSNPTSPTRAASTSASQMAAWVHGPRAAGADLVRSRWVGNPWRTTGFTHTLPLLSHAPGSHASATAPSPTPTLGIRVVVVVVGWRGGVGVLLGAAPAWA